MLWYLGQKIFEITIRVQIVCLGRFCNAVTYSTCFGARNGVYQMPVAFPDYEASYGLFAILCEHSHKALYPQELLIRIFCEKTA